jgi:hypothetical protein
MNRKRSGRTQKRARETSGLRQSFQEIRGPTTKGTKETKITSAGFQPCLRQSTRSGPRILANLRESLEGNFELQ